MSFEIFPGLLDDSVPLPRAVARALLMQKGSGLRMADVPASARKASSDHSEGLNHKCGSLLSRESFILNIFIDYILKCI